MSPEQARAWRRTRGPTSSASASYSTRSRGTKAVSGGVEGGRHAAILQQSQQSSSIWTWQFHLCWSGSSSGVSRRGRKTASIPHMRLAIALEAVSGAEALGVRPSPGQWRACFAVGPAPLGSRHGSRAAGDRRGGVGCLAFAVGTRPVARPITSLAVLPLRTTRATPPRTSSRTE